MGRIRLFMVVTRAKNNIIMAKATGDPKTADHT